MDRPTIQTLASGARYDTDVLNTNFQALRDAFDTLVGTTGASGSNNSMTGDLDLDGNTLRNATFDGTVVGLEWKGGWVTATAYEVNDLVFETDTSYICVEDHTSGVFATDLSASKWEIFASGGVTVTAFMETVLDDATAADARTTLDVQQLNGLLTDIAGITFAQGDVLYYNGTDIINLAPGTAGQVLQTNGAAANPSWAAGNKVVSITTTETGAAATGTTLMPADDTIPQITEGTEFMTAIHTPDDAANILYVEVTVNFESNAGTSAVTAALFKDATVDALAAITMNPGGASFSHSITFKHKITAGSTSAQTFRVRIGGASAGTITFNGNSGSRLMGGIMSSSITVTETLP